jgi:hypothetical protein
VLLAYGAAKTASHAFLNTLPLEYSTRASLASQKEQKDTAAQTW